MRASEAVVVPALAALAALTGAPSPAAAQSVAGHVILAKTNGDAVLLWDATPEVAAVVDGRLGDDAANVRLERDALLVLADEFPKVERARTITVRILYDKTGDVSPVYGTATFAGVETYATLTAHTSDVARERARRRTPDAAATPPPPPPWVTFHVVGELPPR